MLRLCAVAHIMHDLLCEDKSALDLVAHVLEGHELRLGLPAALRKSFWPEGVLTTEHLFAHASPNEGGFAPMEGLRPPRGWASTHGVT